MAHVFFVRTNFSYEKTASLKFGITNFNILGIINLKQKQTKIIEKCNSSMLSRSVIKPSFLNLGERIKTNQLQFKFVRFFPAYLN